MPVLLLLPLILLIVALPALGALRALIICGAHWRWWVRAIVLAAAGVGIGIFFNHFEYFADPTLRVQGVPFPIVVFESSGGVWRDFVGPMTLISPVANCLFFVCVLLSLLSIAIFARFGIWPARSQALGGFPIETRVVDE